MLDLLVPSDGQPQDIDPAVVDKILVFLLTFDPRQVRFIGTTFSNFFTLVGTGQVIPV